MSCSRSAIIFSEAVADLESFVGGGGGGGEHLLAGRWSLSKRRNSGSRSRSVVIHASVGSA